MRITSVLYTPFSVYGRITPTHLDITKAFTIKPRCNEKKPPPQLPSCASIRWALTLKWCLLHDTNVKSNKLLLW